MDCVIDHLLQKMLSEKTMTGFLTSGCHSIPPAFLIGRLQELWCNLCYVFPTNYFLSWNSIEMQREGRKHDDKKKVGEKEEQERK